VAERGQQTAGIKGAIEGLGRGTVNVIETMGGLGLMGLDIVRKGFLPPYRPLRWFEQMDFIGVGSVLLVCLTGMFTGMVFAKQSLYAFGLFRAQSLVGPTVALTLTRELGPVFTALMVTMRAGSAICTEIGTMRVTEQVDALSTIAVDPLHYLVSPRVISAFLMVPLLCLLFDFVGMGGAYIVVVKLEDLSPGTFLTRVQGLLNPKDLFESIVKGAVFGTSVILIACFKGFNAKGGSKGVGQATTEAMVMSAIAIFLLDYLLDVIMLKN
jgi:phospholipid/cholesterol/gamma-HCH transport system permease protein